jgi:hypothetical protein
MKKKPIFYLIFLAILFVFAIPFMIQTSVPALHALAFLIHQDGGWYIPLILICIATAIYLVLGAVHQGDKPTEFKWPWLALIVMVFTVAACLAFTASSASNDPNVSFRYHAFMVANGWSK